MVGSMPDSMVPSSGSSALFFRKSPTIPHISPPPQIKNPSPFKVRVAKSACQLAGINISCQEKRLTARVDDDGEIGHGKLGQLFRPMQRRGIEEQRIARRQ